MGHPGSNRLALAVDFAIRNAVLIVIYLSLSSCYNYSKEGIIGGLPDAIATANATVEELPAPEERDPLWGKKLPGSEDDEDNEVDKDDEKRGGDSRHGEDDSDDNQQKPDRGTKRVKETTHDDEEDTDADRPPPDLGAKAETTDDEDDQDNQDLKARNDGSSERDVEEEHEGGHAPIGHGAPTSKGSEPVQTSTTAAIVHVGAVAMERESSGLGGVSLATSTILPLQQSWRQSRLREPDGGEQKADGKRPQDPGAVPMLRSSRSQPNSPSASEGQSIGDVGVEQAPHSAAAESREPHSSATSTVTVGPEAGLATRRAREADLVNSPVSAPPVRLGLRRTAQPSSSPRDKDRLGVPRVEDSDPAGRAVEVGRLPDVRDSAGTLTRGGREEAVQAEGIEETAATGPKEEGDNTETADESSWQSDAAHGPGPSLGEVGEVKLEKLPGPNAAEHGSDAHMLRPLTSAANGSLRGASTLSPQVQVGTSLHPGTVGEVHSTLEPQITSQVTSTIFKQYSSSSPPPHMAGSTSQESSIRPLTTLVNRSVESVPEVGDVRVESPHATATAEVEAAHPGDTGVIGDVSPTSAAASTSEKPALDLVQSPSSSASAGIPTVRTSAAQVMVDADPVVTTSTVSRTTAEGSHREFAPASATAPSGKPPAPEAAAATATAVRAAPADSLGDVQLETPRLRVPESPEANSSNLGRTQAVPQAMGPPSSTSTSVVVVAGGPSRHVNSSQVDPGVAGKEVLTDQLQ